VRSGRRSFHWTGTARRSQRGAFEPYTLRHVPGIAMDLPKPRYGLSFATNVKNYSTSLPLTIIFTTAVLASRLLTRRKASSKAAGAEMPKIAIPESWIHWWLYGSRRRTVLATRLVSDERTEASTRIPGKPYTLHCQNRAAWRLTAKELTERLSPYYLLRCEYGTSLMSRWQSGGSGPLYVCEGHAKTLKSKENRRAFAISSARFGT
jgi:hypothetical protein